MLLRRTLCALRATRGTRPAPHVSDSVASCQLARERTAGCAGPAPCGGQPTHQRARRPIFSSSAPSLRSASPAASTTTPPPPLLESHDAIRAAVAEAVELILAERTRAVAFHNRDGASPAAASDDDDSARLGVAPAGSGYTWLVSPDRSATTDANVALFESCAEPLPETGSGDTGAALRRVVDDLAAQGLNYAHPGHAGYIPGGGLLMSAVAEFVAAGLNRYTGIFPASPGLAGIEAVTVAWLCDLVGYGDDAPVARGSGLAARTSGGVITTGSSLATLYAIHAAKRCVLPSLADLPRGVLFTSEHSHHSVLKDAVLAGVHPDNVRRIAVDANNRMRVDELQKAMLAAVDDDLLPFCVVASAGTTNTGAVDPLDDVADCVAHVSAAIRDRGGAALQRDVWMHIDGAYGGLFAMTERGRVALKGLQRGDSVCLDPHKAAFLPFGTGVLLAKRRSDLRHAFGDVTGAYMPPRKESESQALNVDGAGGNGDPPMPDDLASLSPELTRPFRALRLWLPLKVYGAAAFRDALDEKLNLARVAADALRDMPGVELVVEPQLSILAFRLQTPQGSGLAADEVDDANRAFYLAVIRRGRAFLTPLKHVHGEPGHLCIRIALLTVSTRREHIDAMISDIRDAAAEVRRELGWDA